MAKSEGLQQAITAAGSMRKLAIRLGISPQAVSYWDDVPAHHILAIERITGVDRSVLRPDLYRRDIKRPGD